MTHPRFTKITAIEYIIQYICLVRDFIFNNGNFSKTCKGHIFYKNSLDIKKRGPFIIVISSFLIKVFLISFFFFSDRKKVEVL